MGDFDAKLRPHLEGMLAPGETLEGICACSQQKGMFKGGAVALGVTADRLLVQPLNRRGDPEGPSQAITPGEIASAKAEGAGGGWAEIGAAIMDEAAVRLTLKLAGGEKLRLMMMRGEGVQALADWFRRAEASR
jgi:hypothetical protein